MIKKLVLGGGGALLFFTAGVWAAEEAKFSITAYDIEGASLLPPATIQSVVERFTGKGRTLADVNAAADALRKTYEDAGYPVVQVFPPVQALDQGRVKLQIIEGQIQAVTIKGNQFYDEANIRASLPPLKEKTKPQASAIIAAIAAANENPGKQVAVNFQAAERLGDIDALVNVTEDRPEKIMVTADNMGSTSTGINRYSIGYQHANLFNRDHMLTLTAGTSFDYPQKSLNLSAGYRIPFYAYGLSLDLIGAYSDSNTTTAVGFGSTQFNGIGTTLGIRLNQPLSSIGEFRHKLIYGFDYKDFDNTCTGASPGKCGTITVQPLSLSYFAQLATPTYQWSGSIALSSNLPGGPNANQPAYAAASNPSGIPNRDGHIDWRAWRLNTNLAIPLPADFQLRAGLAGQFTDDILIPGEQFGIGGASSVRGYMERTATGDSGYSGNIEIYTPDLGKAWGTQLSLRALVFHDFGKTYSNSGKIQLPLTSSGAGLRLNIGRDVAIKLDIGVAHEAFTSNLGTGMTRQRGDKFAHAAVNVSF